MENGFLLAQIIGLCAMGINIAAMQCKNPRHIILCCIPTGVLWSIQYLLLSAPMGALFNICAATKDCFLANVREKLVLFVIVTFLIILWSFGLYMFKNWFDILPLMAGTIMNLALIQRDNRPLIARATIMGQICWFAYNLIVGSWMGLTCSLLVTTSSLIGMARHESWQLGACYRSFAPSLVRSLFTFPNFRTFP